MQESKPRLLDSEFIGSGEVRGFVFKRIKSNKSVHLYEVDGRYYEVFKRSFHNVYNTETYPGSRRFGKTAFTYNNKEVALKKFKELTAKYNKGE